MARAFLERRAEAERASIARTRAALNDELVPGTPADQAAAIRGQLSELAVQSANAGSDLQLAEAARAPSSPYAPRPLRNAVIAFFATLFVAVVAVLVLERLRPRARGALALGRLSGHAGPRNAAVHEGLVWAANGLQRARPIPQARYGRGAGTHRDGQGHVVCGRRHLARAASDRPARAASREPTSRPGSARVAAGVACALARAGHTTLALSTDDGSTNLARELAVPSDPGLVEAGGRAADPDARGRHLTLVHGRDGVAVVSQNGMQARNAGGLLGPGAVDAFFASLSETSYGYVVIETPGLSRTRSLDCLQVTPTRSCWCVPSARPSTTS